MNRLYRKHKKEQHGQIVIVVILVMLVISLVVLAATSRSITDVGISRTSDDSARAFSAAEAGIETAVEKINEGILTPASNVPLSSGATYGYDITPAIGSKDFLSPSPLSSDIQTLQVYLANKDNLTTGIYSGTSICLLWGNEGTLPGHSDTPAIEAALIYRNTSGQLAVKRFAIDPNARASFTPANNSCPKTSAATDNNLGVARTFAFSHNLSFDLGAGESVALLRLRLLYNATTAHYVGVSPQIGSPLPAQGYKISSTGTTSGATRKVEVFQAYPSLPALFDFVLFNGSGNAITK